jgi:hypothetical protein
MAGAIVHNSSLMDEKYERNIKYYLNYYPDG